MGANEALQQTHSPTNNDFIHYFMLTYIHTYIHIYIHLYLHTYICTYICTYIQTFQSNLDCSQDNNQNINMEQLKIQGRIWQRRGDGLKLSRLEKGYLIELICQSDGRPFNFFWRRKWRSAAAKKSKSFS